MAGGTAAAPVPTMTNDSPFGGTNLAGVSAFLKTILGTSETSTSSGGTSTSQTILSADAENALIKRLTEGVGGIPGLAEVSSGQKNAGMYGTTTNQLLTNDLLARIGNNVAVAGAPTVTTKPETKVTAKAAPVASLGTAIAGLGLGMIGKKVLDKTGISKSIDSGLDKITSTISQSMDDVKYGVGNEGLSDDYYLNGLGGSSTTDAAIGGTAAGADALSTEGLVGGFGSDAVETGITAGAETALVDTGAESLFASAAAAEEGFDIAGLLTALFI